MTDPIGFATQVGVRLGEENGDLILVVRDNGKGITEEQLSAGTSLGILGMRELLGGTLTISGTPEKGPRLESNFRTPTKPGSRCDQGSDCR